MLWRMSDYEIYRYSPLLPFLTRNRCGARLALWGRMAFGAFVRIGVVVATTLFASGCTPLQGSNSSSGISVLPVAPSPVLPPGPTEGVPKFRLFTRQSYSE